MLIMTFDDPAHCTAFLDAAIYQGIMGTAWRDSLTVVLMTSDSEKAQRLAVACHGKSASLRRTPLAGQRFIDGVVRDVVICNHCDKDVTEDAYTLIDVGGRDVTICPPCLGLALLCRK